MDDFVTSLQQIQTASAFVVLILLSLVESLHPFYDFFRQEPGDRGRHAVRNLALGLLNGGVVSFVFVSLWFLAAAWAAEHQFGLFPLIRRHLEAPAWVYTVGAVLLLDAWTYIWHRLNHAVPVFWRFHRVHHADARMDVTTASRFHLGEIVLSSILRIPLIVVLGIDLWELIAYETVMFAVVQLQHANIVLPDRVDRFLRLLIVTPAMHKVHHSRWRPETDSNYSSLFSFWDRIGRSFQIRKDLTSLSMGLDAFDAPENRTLSGLMKIPFSTPPHRNEAGAHPPLEA